ncbi:MAG: cob(I)yrinic acid a,c-diamide adenosyltransferase [candidate division Zixibacteria bacterium RBG_16_50_21]|nr:MAG: cob(I)yrinic acid a,c-diamide adenosyltransferase [candidate division Zixibacteria bacterium RBG_16_50_21]
MNQTKERQGLIIVYTGDGKGKTTAALGTILRAIGYNWKVCVIQFIKGSWTYGEMKGLKRLEPDVVLKVLGQGFVGIIDDKKPIEEHIAAAQGALKAALEDVQSDKYDLIILDEINVALNLGLIDLSEVKKLLTGKPKRLHLILTGRGAPQDIIDMADLVTEMKEIKHPYQKGILAQKGVDF